ncbi:hypothetical protein [Desulfofustis glycolicus]|uniref:hypothetical protein n=1 Tax=Desulfofustis glycolicus TaxID=51195 RepID=UPI001160E461|nr:hypothetical protein [Desulfofustis glycolicus]
MAKGEVRISTAIYKGNEIHIAEAVNLSEENGEKLIFNCVECGQLVHIRRESKTFKQTIHGKEIFNQQRACFEHSRTSTDYCPLKDPRNKNNKKSND